MLQGAGKSFSSRHASSSSTPSGDNASSRPNSPPGVQKPLPRNRTTMVSRVFEALGARETRELNLSESANSTVSNLNASRVERNIRHNAIMNARVNAYLDGATGPGTTENDEDDGQDDNSNANEPPIEKGGAKGGAIRRFAKKLTASFSRRRRKR
jgi:hypothetical protein